MTNEQADIYRDNDPIDGEPDHIWEAIKSLRQAIEQAEKQVVFKIYKPTLPRGAIPNVQDAELPWVYDQDPSSGNVASMWVTPVKATPQPQRKWVGLTDEEIALVCAECAASAHNWNDISFAHAIEAKLKDKNHVS
ncbi:MAG: hypothetical protein EBS98_10935 [Chitinophagia bacterium]|nr:hypothetical protein [Chitinophagia bacterium]